MLGTALLPAAVIAFGLVLMPVGAVDWVGMSALLQPAAASVSEISHARVHCSYAFNNILALSLEVRARNLLEGYSVIHCCRTRRYLRRKPCD